MVYYQEKMVDRDALCPIIFTPQMLQMSVFEDSTNNCIIVPTIAFQYQESLGPRISRGCFQGSPFKPDNKKLILFSRLLPARQPTESLGGNIFPKTLAAFSPTWFDTKTFYSTESEKLSTKLSTTKKVTSVKMDLILKASSGNSSPTKPWTGNCLRVFLKTDLASIHPHHLILTKNTQV